MIGTRLDISGAARAALRRTLPLLLALGAVCAAAGSARAEVLFEPQGVIGTAVVKLADGSLLVGGDAAAGARFAVMKLRPDGRVDTRFGHRGISQVMVGRSDFNDLSGLLVLRDGRILASGSVGTDDSVQRGTGTEYGVARLTRAGRLDKSFGGRGWRRFTPFPSNPSDKSEWIAQMADGRVMIGGDSQPDLSAAPLACAFSFNVDLVRSPGFAPLCEQLPGSQSDFGDAAPGPANTTVLAIHGLDDKSHVRLGLTRATAAGAIDKRFGAANGATLSDFGALPSGLNQTGVTRLRARAGGGWLLAGAVPGGFGFAGFRSNGMLDPSFGSQGRVVLRPGSSKHRDVLVDVVREDGGRKFLAIGQSELVQAGQAIQLSMIRIDAKGRLDRSFGRGGRLTLTSRDLGAPSIAQIDAAALLGNGDVVIVGASYRRSYGLLAVRLKPNGRVDRSFG